ncbi:cilia- and flagella-associated protein 144 isoform X1 [Malurus melanocephalus]|uniref:cilia- and flagella-associated protein 144 isoform X1 n=1 Tax=Malurus melanocephalus TaxID=175006 RepID=UPI0025485C8F|nr:cilia- and flagella-associated protein 144 isoform X1 [Malurus melanocephalus]
MSGRHSDRGPPDALLNRLHTERANKERKWQLVFTQYTVNPLHPVHMVSRKPMSWHENIQEATDDEFLNLLHRAVQIPRMKYSEPQTESQEIGWNTTPLVPVDRSDCRLYFPRQTTEITKYGYPKPRGDKSKD